MKTSIRLSYMKGCTTLTVLRYCPVPSNTTTRNRERSNYFSRILVLSDTWKHQCYVVYPSSFKSRFYTMIGHLRKLRLPDKSLYDEVCHRHKNFGLLSPWPFRRACSSWGNNFTTSLSSSLLLFSRNTIIKKTVP